ncbi:hypothetical protein VNO77_12351 [Canavalia gladiata]|uniref:Myb-like protein X n=1 Tax=Canavalia gladiata TaxID=3824 RepID=A0AAN9LWM6_CANGL
MCFHFFFIQVASPFYLNPTNQGFPSKLIMIKRFPSRNQRSKGIKVKHVLQIILLVGVCFWLIFQVKHNHDKKKEFAKKDAKVLVSTQTDEILKLGRRDLHPGKNEVNQNEKHEEEEEDDHIEEDEENKHGHKEQEEGNKHETKEPEDNQHEEREQGEDEKHHAEEQEEDENKSEDMEDENKSEDMEDEERGGGEGEIDGNDQEKPEVDPDRDDEFLDEEKEKEDVSDEKENEKEDEEKVGFVESLDNHEAREEHYKGDDASSAVAHDSQATRSETETFSLENSDENLEMKITKPENKSTYSDEGNRNQNDSDLRVKEGEVIDRVSLNATAGKETENSSLSNPADSAYLNRTTTSNTEDNHLESSSNLTVVIPEAGSNFTGAGGGADNSGSSELNETVILSESDHAQNTTMNPTTITGDVKKVQIEGLEHSGNRIAEENLPETNSTVSVTTENGDGSAQETSNLGAGELEKTNRYVALNVTVNTSRNESSDSTTGNDKSKSNTETSETNETQNVDAAEDEMFRDTQTGETDETSDSSTANETLDSVEHDAIDSSDTHIHEDVTNARTDLDTLPDIRNEGDNGDDTAAE